MKVAELNIQRNIQSIQQPSSEKISRRVPQSNQDINKTSRFGELLEKRLQDNQSLRFSAHAIKRLDQRQITITQQNMDRLNEGLSRVEKKGSQSSLLFMDGTAFVLSVPNKTIITALSPEATRENVFTNIDSVAVV